MGDLNLAGEIVVDLFAGIGYWTLQLLKRSNASFVHGKNICFYCSKKNSQPLNWRVQPQ